MLKVKLEQVENAKDLDIPQYMTKGSAGLDLYASEEKTLNSSKVALISTGIKMSIPEGYEAQIRPRSGLAAKNSITVLNTPGTIDSDFRGEIKVILINFSEKDFQINRGDRIAQMIFNKIEKVEFELVDKLDETKRGDGGFGHSGK